MKLLVLLRINNGVCLTTLLFDQGSSRLILHFILFKLISVIDVYLVGLSLVLIHLHFTRGGRLNRALIGLAGLFLIVVR